MDSPRDSTPPPPGGSCPLLRFGGDPEEYVPLSVIGRGSYGLARLVQCKRTGEKRVLKEISTQSMSEDDRMRCLREMHILREMSHPNIVSHIASQFSDQRSELVILMEYCDGGDLSTKIKPGVPMPSHEVILYTVQLVLALHYLHHEKKVLHRDLKPSNIFLTCQGLVKLGDFGVSTILSKTVEFAKTFCGTPYYLSPELCQDKPYNSRSDMWALGCILYEMCTGTRPFVKKNIVELAECINRGEYTPLPETVDAGLRDTIVSLLQRVPEVRPSAYRLLRGPFIQHHLQRLVKSELDYPLARASLLQTAPSTKSIVKGAANMVGGGDMAAVRKQEMQTMEQYVAQTKDTLDTIECQKYGFMPGSFDMSQELRGSSSSFGFSVVGVGASADLLLVDEERSPGTIVSRKFIF